MRVQTELFCWLVSYLPLAQLRAGFISGLLEHIRAANSGSNVFALQLPQLWCTDGAVQLMDHQSGHMDGRMAASARA